ncbi:chemotaxis protein [Glaciimonas soli]|uniref:Chemotaxis protein n=1 Tax=Glaciimonas soli TaxID=2590999 RepID=A0A843YYR2_9BURK|nr:chemotaxis protein [Glaciimonas soli]MQR02332.1 chemotaxis protein [Glaciimonas soli]
MDMNQLGDVVPGGTSGVIGSIAAAVFACFIFLRKYLASDAAARADDLGKVSALDLYKQLLESERTARISADARADQFAKERNEAWQMMGDMRGELMALREEVKQLRDQINAGHNLGHSETGYEKSSQGNP